MIMLCERCFAPIGDDEPVVRLLGGADGGVRWGYRYRHPGGVPRCVPPRPARRPGDQVANGSGNSRDPS